MSDRLISSGLTRLMEIKKPLTEDDYQIEIPEMDDLPQSLKDEIEQLYERGFDPSHLAGLRSSTDQFSRQPGLLLPTSCLPKVEEFIVLQEGESILQKLSKVVEQVPEGKAIVLDFPDARDPKAICDLEQACQALARRIQEKRLTVRVTERTRDAVKKIILASQAGIQKYSKDRVLGKSSKGFGK